MTIDVPRSGKGFALLGTGQRGKCKEWFVTLSSYPCTSAFSKIMANGI